MKHRIAIIGGGLSGLATAANLCKNSSVDVRLFEASDRLGGVIHTERVGDFLIDHGADMFALQPPAAIKLVREMGLENHLIEPNEQGRGARVVHRGNLVPIPDGFVLMRATQVMPMLTTPLLSVPGKLRLLYERWVPAASDSNDESIEQFVCRRMGREVLDRLVAPLAAGIYTADVSKLSMQATMAPIAQMEREYGSLTKAMISRRRSGEDSVERVSTGARYGQFRAFRGGMIEFIEALANTLDPDAIQLSTSVRSLTRRDEQWLVTTNSHDEDCFDRVVLATPAAAASRLLSEIAPSATQNLARIESASTAIVVLGVPDSSIAKDINAFGFVVPEIENRRILAGSFASNKFAGRAPEGHTLIRVFIGGALHPELLDLSDQQLIEIAREELQDLIGLTGTPAVSLVVRWNHAMPQYHVGHQERVRDIDQAMAEVEGIELVNNALHGVGIAPVIQLAGEVAERISASFTTTPAEEP